MSRGVLFKQWRNRYAWEIWLHPPLKQGHYLGRLPHTHLCCYSHCQHWQWSKMDGVDWSDWAAVRCVRLVTVDGMKYMAARCDRLIPCIYRLEMVCQTTSFFWLPWKRRERCHYNTKDWIWSSHWRAQANVGTIPSISHHCSYHSISPKNTTTLPMHKTPWWIHSYLSASHLLVVFIHALNGYLIKVRWLHLLRCFMVAESWRRMGHSV